MSTSASKENILKRIRQALSHPVSIPFPNSEGAQSVFKTPADDDAVVFAEEFTKLQGKFAFCTNNNDLIEQIAALIHEREWKSVYSRDSAIKELIKNISVNHTDDLANCDVSITGCEYLVARTGTIVMSTAQESGRTTSVYAPIHICIAYNHQMVYDLKEALQFIKEKYSTKLPSLITFASGPSRTADIEKTLVTGVHGPKEVYCFLVESN